MGIEHDYTIENEDDGEEEAIPNIFLEDDENASKQESLDEDGNVTDKHSNVSDAGAAPPMHPKSIGADASASEMVRVWAAYLQYVYKQCQPPPGTEMPDMYDNNSNDQ